MPPITEITWDPEQPGPMADNPPLIAQSAPIGPGVMLVAVAAAGGEIITLTAALNGNNIGFISGLMGAVNPTILGGASILGLQRNSATGEFQVALAGNLAQTFFSSVEINGFTFETALATFLVIAGVVTTWTWAVDPGFGIGDIDAEFFGL